MNFQKKKKKKKSCKNYAIQLKTHHASMTCIANFDY